MLTIADQLLRLAYLVVTRVVNLPREGRSISVGGDIIAGIDGNDVRNKHDLLLYLTGKKVGDSVELSIIRNGNQEKLTVTLGERPGYGFS
jgi:S1-C subfamily serine protease